MGGRMCRRYQTGFTLVEVITVTVVMGIVLAIAIPNFADLVRNSRMTTQANDLMADMLYARSEAASRGVRVVICASADQATCSGSATDWANGRVIFVDANNNQTLDAGETTLQVRNALTGQSVLTPSGFNSQLLIRFNPYGAIEPLGSNGNFKLCPPGYAQGRQVAVEVSGRPTVTRVSDCPVS